MFKKILHHFYYLKSSAFLTSFIQVFVFPFLHAFFAARFPQLSSVLRWVGSKPNIALPNNGRTFFVHAQTIVISCTLDYVWPVSYTHLDVYKRQHLHSIKTVYLVRLISRTNGLALSWFPPLYRELVEKIMGIWNLILQKRKPSHDNVTELNQRTHSYSTLLKAVYICHNKELY